MLDIRFWSCSLSSVPCVGSNIPRHSYSWQILDFIANGEYITSLRQQFGSGVLEAVADCFHRYVYIDS